MPPAIPTVAFFGATGGVTNAVLCHTLNAGYKAAALVRTPQKLRDQLTAQGIDAELLRNLTIVEGNALEVPAVKRTLTQSSPRGLPDFVISGLGGAPRMQFNLRHPLSFIENDQPGLCGTAAETLVAATKEIYAENPSLKANKPLVAFISTTGITKGPDDVPFSLRFLYHHILALPHVDKRNMERAFFDDHKSTDSAFRSFVGVRSTLLSGSADYKDAVGLDKIRSGLEAEPALGYIIKRADVGHWVFENVINEKTRKSEYVGQFVTLTS